MSPPSPGMRSAPLLDSSHHRPHFNLSPSAKLATLPPVSHSRSLSAGGSFGKSTSNVLELSSEFHKYTEGPDEDYEDVFGKVVGHGKRSAVTLVIF